MPRPAFTLLELLIVCTIIGIAAGIAVPRLRAATDSFAVEGAVRDVASAFAFARVAALRHEGADVAIDSLGVTVHAGGQVVYQRAVAARHGVAMRSSVALVRYAGTGLGIGLSNGSVFVSRGSRADTVVISRLGRVRR
jgi:prepilin-type N-terminal cleavage/methylation domain-containing protein